MRILKKGKNKQLSKHFNQKEIDCSCDNPRCFYTIVRTKSIDCLEATRSAVYGGKPFSPTSAFRCQSHNEEVGGVEKSKHCLGDACDVPKPESMEWNDFEYRLLNIWEKVILYKNKEFAHCSNSN